MTVNGRYLVVGLVTCCVIAGAGLIYTQNYAYYQNVTVSNSIEMEEDMGRGGSTVATEIRLTRLVGGIPESIPVSGFTGIDARTSPLKFRGCFVSEHSLEQLKRRYVQADHAVPLRPPAWFDCFDVKRLTEDLATGDAVAFLGEREIAPGVDRLVAVYPDQRAFAWHQFNQDSQE